MLIAYFAEMQHLKNSGANAIIRHANTVQPVIDFSNEYVSETIIKYFYRYSQFCHKRTLFSPVSKFLENKHSTHSTSGVWKLLVLNFFCVYSFMHFVFMYNFICLFVLCFIHLFFYIIFPIFTSFKYN